MRGRRGSAALAARDLLALTAYSYAVGNGDLHGKNHSVLRRPDGIWAAALRGP